MLIRFIVFNVDIPMYENYSYNNNNRKEAFPNVVQHKIVGHGICQCFILTICIYIEREREFKHMNEGFVI